MPRGDGTGPTVQGRGIGRGRGRMGGPQAAGPGGECVCPACGARTKHVAGKPCSQQTCSNCGARMARD